jgi:hypothetical protein
MGPQAGDIIDVWFSCGAASAVALQQTLLRYGNLCQVRALNNPIAEEDADNRRFLRDVEQWLGITIQSVINPKLPNASAVEVWDREKYMSGVSGAPCTKKLKREARQAFENLHPAQWLVMGFTAEEQSRHDNFVFSERANLLPVLIDAKLNKQDCAQIIVDAGLALPAMYAMGYPNANCPGCVKATSPTYWNHVRAMHPDVFAARAEQSRRLGVRLVRHKGQRIFLDELPPDAAGLPMKAIKMPECGLFCEERLVA